MNFENIFESKKLDFETWFFGWLQVLQQSESFEVEVSEESKDFVYAPVIKYFMAPRDARGILEIAGVLMNQGISSEKIFLTLYLEFSAIIRREFKLEQGEGAEAVIEFKK